MIATDITTAGPDDEIDLIGLVRTLWRYKWLIALVVLVCSGIAVALALTTTPLFRGEALVAEAGESKLGAGAGGIGQIEGLASLVGVNISGGEDSVKARAVLQSRNLLEEFIARNQLIPVLLPPTDERKFQPTLWRAVEKFRRDVVTIKEDPRRNVTTVTVEWTDPQIAAKWANELVALANELLRSKAISESERNIAYLNEQIRKTDVVQLQTVMYNLVESEMQRLMLANGRLEYSFVLVDPAVAPEVRTSPQRTIMVMIGGLIGVILGAAIAFIHQAIVRYSTRTEVAR